MRSSFVAAATILVGISLFLFLFSNQTRPSETTRFAQGDQPGYEDQVKRLGVELNRQMEASDHFVPATSAGSLVFLSGHGPKRADGSYATGKVGAELSTEEGYDAARDTMIALLSSLKREIGSLDRVKRILKVHGMVNCVTSYAEQPAVINGATALLTEIFGENGKPARAAIGVGSLPRNIPVEIEMIVEIWPERSN